MRFVDSIFFSSMLSACTASVGTFLPKEVVDTIKGEWVPRFLSNGGTFQSGSPTENAVPDIQSADLIFEFVGVDDRPVRHRCTARQFLSSPWYTVIHQPYGDKAREEDNARTSDSDMRLLNNLIFPMPPPEEETSNNPVTKVGILGLVSRHPASTFMYGMLSGTSSYRLSFGLHLYASISHRGPESPSHQAIVSLLLNSRLSE